MKFVSTPTLALAMASAQSNPVLKTFTSSTSPERRRTDFARNDTETQGRSMAQFLEFLTFELKFRVKSISTYVYFALWFFLSFLAIAAEDFLNTGNDKILLNGPFSTSILYIVITFFGVIVIAAIFGSSILRDFQRDTYQIIFTKPISKFAYLGGRWAASMLVAVLIFAGIPLGELLGTFAPWADHSRIGPNHLPVYLMPFLSLVVLQIFFLGSLFFCVAALTRKI